MQRVKITISGTYVRVLERVSSNIVDFTLSIITSTGRKREISYINAGRIVIDGFVEVKVSFKDLMHLKLGFHLSFDLVEEKTYVI